LFKSLVRVGDTERVDETDASSTRTEPPSGDVAEPSIGNCWYLNCRLAIFLAACSLSSIFRAFKQAIGRREMQYAFNF
jgi:hypothetical protein